MLTAANVNTTTQYLLASGTCMKPVTDMQSSATQVHQDIVDQTH